MTLNFNYRHQFIPLSPSIFVDLWVVVMTGYVVGYDFANHGASLSGRMFVDRRYNAGRTAGMTGRSAAPLCLLSPRLPADRGRGAGWPPVGTGRSEAARANHRHPPLTPPPWR